MFPYIQNETKKNSIGREKEIHIAAINHYIEVDSSFRRAINVNKLAKTHSSAAAVAARFPFRR